MSGDVQPRKRKDKKKKRDDEASHGVHITKMGSDDVLLHVHEEHGTGGHWCAKLIFFSLMTILMGLVCLIILENRGLSDVDTPLSESRFSNYFDGWVDETRNDHDDHHDSHGSLEHDDHDEHGDEDDDHGEPFEEEPDHSEGDEEEVVDEDDENVTPEEETEDGDNITAENVTAEDDEDAEDEDDEEDNVTAEVDDNITAEVDEDGDENVTGEDDNITKEQNDQDDDEDEDDANKTNEDDQDDNVTKETSKPTSQDANDDDDDDAFDEDDDDGNFDSLEKIVDNDAAELQLLKEKARQQAAESNQNAASTENDLDDEADNAPSWASSQIKPKTGGGPQSLEDLDSFEKELRRANDEMMQELNYH